MNPPFKILKIQLQIWFQPAQKLKYHQFYLNPNILNISGSPFFILKIQRQI